MSLVCSLRGYFVQELCWHRSGYSLQLVGRCLYKIFFFKKPPYISSQYIGVTVLMTAVFYQNEAIALFLLERGALPIGATAKGSTVLHWAAWKGMSQIIVKVLEWGLEVDVQADNGIAPIP